MNSRSLEYVVALKRTGSLQAAAEHCNATVGTVSAQISRLEDYLGVRLFVQRRAPAEPTEEGQRLLEMIESIVVGMQGVRQLARANRQARLKFSNAVCELRR